MVCIYITLTLCGVCCVCANSVGFVCRYAATSGVKNTTSGVKNTTSGVKNTTSGVKNTTSGVKDTTSGVKNTTSGVKNTTSGVKNTCGTPTRNKSRAHVFGLICILGLSGTKESLCCTHRHIY